MPKVDFWDHLDALRSTLLRILAAVTLCGLVCFAFKEQLFAFLLGPSTEAFPTYILFRRAVGDDLAAMQPFSVNLINTELAGQFVVHMKAAFAMGALVASPYILFELFRFLAPALYEKEHRILIRIAGGSYTLFLIGCALSYLLLFPLTFRFLGTYQVATAVSNLISLDSYMSTLLGMTFMVGLMFELPIVCLLLAKTGILKSHWMKEKRRHAIVALLTLAAIITPTGDLFTLAVVFLPLYLLYEASLLITHRYD